MNIDRSKHNKYTSIPVYGTLSTGGISTDSTGNVTGTTGVSYGGGVVYVSGGSGSISPELLELLKNQDAFSYFKVGDGLFYVTAEAKKEKDIINFDIIGDGETVETHVTSEKYLEDFMVDSTGSIPGTYAISYNTYNVIEIIGGTPTQVTKWLLTIDKRFGNPIFANTDFNGVQLLNDNTTVHAISLANERVTIDSDEANGTGLLKITINFDELVEFDTIRLIYAEDFNTAVFDNISTISGILLEDYIVVKLSQVGASRIWNFDGNGDVYTDYNAYSKGTLGAWGNVWTNLGFFINNWSQGVSGGAFYVSDENGTTYAEVDKLRVRKKAYFETLEIVNVNTVGGKLIISPGGAITVCKVEVFSTYYRCYFLGEQDGTLIDNRFQVGDLAFSLNFNITPGIHQGVSNHYYWRAVVGVSLNINADGNHYIDLSISDCDVASDIPQVNDVVAQLGSKTNIDRQSAIVFDAVAEESPRMILCNGINNYTLANTNQFDVGVYHSTNKAYMNVYGDAYIGNRATIDQSTGAFTPGSSYIWYDASNNVVKIKADVDFSSTIGGKRFDECFITTENFNEYTDSVIANMQNQIDGNIESYFEKWSPTLNNQPASDWITNGEQLRHEGDTFTNIINLSNPEEADLPDASDAGKSWRWTRTGENDSNGNPIFNWTVISDSDAVAALKKAGEAQDTADGKRRVFVSQPTNADSYDVGDLWVNATYNNAVGLEDYTNELLRCIQSKTSGLAFNINHWGKASKYTDDALALQAVDSIQGVSNTLESLQNQVDTFESTVEGAFKDGIIDTLEEETIRSQISTLEKNVLACQALKDRLLENTILTDDQKGQVNSAYTALDAATGNLTTVVNNAINDNAVSLKESEVVQNAFTAYDTAYAAFASIVEELNNQVLKYLKTNIDTAAAALRTDLTQAQKDIASTSTSLGNYKTEIGNILSDGVIESSEKRRLATLRETVNTAIQNAQAQYEDLINNSMLNDSTLENSSTQKNNLINAFGNDNKGFMGAVKSFLNYIDSLLDKEDQSGNWTVTATEINTVDTKYQTLNAKYGDLTAVIVQVNMWLLELTGEKARASAVNSYAYLTGLFELSTEITGAVIATGLIEVGITTNEVRKTNGGLNGAPVDSKSIGFWLGGDMIDGQIPENKDKENIAKSVIRFDGTGYFGYNVNEGLPAIYWDEEGRIYADPMSFYVGEERLGFLTTAFGFTTSGDIMYQNKPFREIRIGDAYLGYDVEKNAVYVYTYARDEHGNIDTTTKVECNFFALGEVAAYGLPTGSSGPSAGANYLSELNDVLLDTVTSGDLLQYNGVKWVNVSKDSIGLNETELQSYLNEHSYVTESEVADLIGDVDLSKYLLANGGNNLTGTLKVVINSTTPSLSGMFFTNSNTVKAAIGNVNDGTNIKFILLNPKGILNGYEGLIVGDELGFNGHQVFHSGNTIIPKMPDMTKYATAASLVNYLPKTGGKMTANTSRFLWVEGNTSSTYMEFGYGGDTVGGIFGWGGSSFSFKDNSYSDVGAIVGYSLSSHGGLLSVATGINGLTYRHIGNTYKVYHSGNLTSLKNPNILSLKINGGTVEGTTVYNYDGSVVKALNIVAGSNVTFTTSAGKLTINATDTIPTDYSLFGNIANEGATDFGDTSLVVGAYSNPSAGQVFYKRTALNMWNYIKKKADANYLSKSGGAVTGRITRSGVFTSWNKGRDNAIVAVTSLSGYSPAFSLKTNNGSWDIGAYNNSSYYNKLVFSYVPDTNYSGDNLTPNQVLFASDGNIYSNSSLVYHSGNLTKSTLGLGNVDNTADANKSVAYAANAGNAGTLGGISLNADGSKPFGKIPAIRGDGVMEIGHYLDFHYDNTTGSDYSTRLQVGGNYSNTVTLPSAGGTLALTSYAYSKSESDSRYVNASGDTMTGVLTTTYGSNGAGIKVGDTYINYLNTSLLFQGSAPIRFGSINWDWNTWAGLKYTHSSKTVYLGIADGTQFAANSAQSGGLIKTPGISDIYVGDGTYKVWHAGNGGRGSGLDADLLDGVHNGSLTANSVGNIAYVSDANYSYQNGSGYNVNGITCWRGNNSTLNIPSGTSNAWNIINIGMGGGHGASYQYAAQLYFGTQGNVFYFRNQIGASFRDWRQVAFTDSNVASATKLQTARTIWGQSFDGTGNIEVSKNVTTNYVQFKGTDNSTNAGWVGRGSTASNNIYITAEKSNDILFVTNNGGSERMRILSGGNIGIGTSSPSAKLHVVGSICSTETIKQTNTSGTTPHSRGMMYYDGSTLRGVIGSVHDTTTIKYMQLNPSGNLDGYSGLVVSANAIGFNGHLILHTGNTVIPKIPSRVPYADKLYTTRTIWGLSFNGSGNVNGLISLIAPSSLASYNQGIRLSGSAKDGTWSNIQFGADSTATTGTHTNLWMIGRDNNNNFLIGSNSLYNSNPAFYAQVGGGNVGIGTSSPSYKLHVMGSVYANGGNFRISGNGSLYWEAHGGSISMTDNTWIRFNSSLYTNALTIRTDGSLQVGSNGEHFLANTSSVTCGHDLLAKGEITAYSSASDMRLKDVILYDYDALDLLSSLSTFKYKWNDIAKTLNYDVLHDDEEHFGLSALELQSISNTFVSKTKIDGKYLTLKKDELVPLLVQAIKQLTTKVKELELKYEALLF